MTSQLQLRFHRKMSILATQIDLLDYYDTNKAEERRTESFEIINSQMHQQNPSYKKINNLMQKYDFYLSYFRADDCETERNPEVRKKLRELSGLLSPTTSHSS